MLVHHNVTPPSILSGFLQFISTHLNSWVEKSTLKTKSFAQEHSTFTQPGLKQGPLDLESSALTMKAQQLLHG